MVPRIALLSTSDTDLLSARGSGADYVVANPARSTHAELGEVLAAWAGLGYYARARNLHACAREVVMRFGGRFPETEADLRTLPGIGG